MDTDDINNVLALLNGDAIPNLLASVAIILSLIALLVTTANNRLTRRQSLTETIDELAKIQIAVLELQKDEGHKTERGVSIRRVHGLQRRFYAQLGTELISKLPTRLITDIDYNLLATACNDSSLPLLAEEHWNACVAKSADNPSLLAMNRRGLARFYFLQGRVGEGRKHYQESLDVPLPDNYDALTRLRADTYRMWARQEIDAGFPAQGEHLVQLALAESAKIKHATSRQEQQEYIALLRVKLKELEAKRQAPAAGIAADSAAP
jgi:hypothetical protein